MATTYILRCADNKLYVGSTTNIVERLKRHKAGFASEFTHLHRPVELVYQEEYATYQEAFKRERQLKKWSRAKKEALIAGDIDKLKELSKSK
jgi:predicted GIY-YIG superfamily endonuclease